VADIVLFLHGAVAPKALPESALMHGTYGAAWKQARRAMRRLTQQSGVSKDIRGHTFSVMWVLLFIAGVLWTSLIV
jgi:hypothetical protein